MLTSLIFTPIKLETRNGNNIIRRCHGRRFDHEHARERYVIRDIRIMCAMFARSEHVRQRKEIGPGGMCTVSGCQFPVSCSVFTGHWKPQERNRKLIWTLGLRISCGLEFSVSSLDFVQDPRHMTQDYKSPTLYHFRDVLTSFDLRAFSRVFARRKSEVKKPSWATGPKSVPIDRRFDQWGTRNASSFLSVSVSSLEFRARNKNAKTRFRSNCL